jgi:uncharacterized protein YndB with AHSA1/START domain
VIVWTVSDETDLIPDPAKPRSMPATGLNQGSPRESKKFSRDCPGSSTLFVVEVKEEMATPKGEKIMSGNTIQLHRVVRATPEKVYRAFLNGDAMAKWLPPNGFTGKVHHMDAKVGGTYKMSFTNFSTGKSHSFGGEYLELVPNERLRYTDRFDDPGLPGEMQTTITLKKVSCGTELNIVQEGVPGAIPAEACYLGWQESLNLLAQLVEPEIPD